MTEKYEKRKEFLKSLEGALRHFEEIGPEEYGIVDDDVWKALLEDIEQDVRQVGWKL